MGDNNELKKTDIKNRMCYCSDNIMKVKNVDFHNILLDEKSYKYILTYIS